MKLNNLMNQNKYTISVGGSVAGARVSTAVGGAGGERGAGGEGGAGGAEERSMRVEICRLQRLHLHICARPIPLLHLHICRLQRLENIILQKTKILNNLTINKK